MRPLFAAVLAGALAVAASAAAAPAAAPGYRLATATAPGAVFSGLARDGDALVLTDLASGRLYRRDAAGAILPFGPTLPHGPDVIGDPTGPYRVARVDGAYVVAQGWTPVDSDEGPYDHALVAIDDTGAIRVVSNDFWNPFAFVASDGAYFVVDAARNSIERIDAGGSRSTLAAFARMSASATALQNLSPTEFAEGETYDFDAVPTGIALRRDRLYVSLFGGFPFVAGAGKVVSLAAAGGAPEPVLDDLNAPVDIAFAPDGRLLVLEHGLYDQGSGFRPGSGRLLSVDIATGDRQVVVDGLTRPASVLVWDARQLVVSELGGTLYFLTHEPADQP
ncbi:MAG: ScyD/ScyE family protein [Bauldia sp.]|nr:ScyD/ScyE family protein [Bauldia sp.]